MMDTTIVINIAATLAMVLLCAIGLLVACFSFSGTWFVVAAAAIAALLDTEGYPGWWSVVLYAGLAAAVEGVEFCAGYLGVRRRAGSRLAGLLALVGGMAGMALGGMFLPPVIGPLVGMAIVSFTLVYVIERRRLTADRAARVARGAVISHILVILLKVGMTLALASLLLLRLVF